MVAAQRVSGRRLSVVPRTAAQTRILDAALDLIAEHGVSGTSLQMIADTVGVTKAAVYHQFKTKNEIVIALTARELAGLADVLDAAEAAESMPRGRELLLARVIEVAVERRRAASTLQFDPVVVRLLAEHEPFQEFINRLYGVLIGPVVGAADEARIAAAVLSGAIGVAVTHPLVAEIDDDTLRKQLARLTRRVLGLPPGDQSGDSSRSAAE